jgi:hypothetical protein
VKDEEKFEEYLSNLENDPVNLPFVFAEQIKAFWRMIRNKDSGIPLPIAGPGGELGFQFVWDTDRYYLEIDIGHNGDLEWFFSDREKGWIEGDDDFAKEQSSDRMMTLLRRISGNLSNPSQCDLKKCSFWGSCNIKDVPNNCAVYKRENGEEE